MPIELNDSGIYTTKQVQSCSSIDFEVFHSDFDTCVLLPCAITELVSVVELIMKFYQYKHKEFYNSEEVRYLKVQVIVIEGHCKSSGMIQTLPGHDRRHCDGHFLSAPKMCSVIWSLQKSHLTQICLVIWCFCKSQTTNSNISPAKHRQLDFYRVQVTPSM